MSVRGTPAEELRMACKEQMNSLVRVLDLCDYTPTLLAAYVGLLQTQTRVAERIEGRLLERGVLHLSE